MVKRVAVLVHNEVFKDARVRKEAATLVKAGLSVDVFGITKEWTDHPSSVDGAHVELLTDKSALRRAKLKSIVKGRKAEVAIVLAVAGLMGWVFSTGQTDWVLRLLLLCALGSVFAVGCLPAARRQRNSTIRGAISAAMALLTLTLIYFKLLQPWDALWVYLGVWTLLRLNPSPSRLRIGAASATREGRYNSLAKVLADRVLAGKYDVVHCHDIIALIAGGLIKRARPSVMLIWDAHEIYEDMANGRPEDRDLVRDIIRRNQGLVDHFITINESISTFYRKNYSLPGARVVMNATQHRGPVVYDGRLHRASGLNPDRKILIFQGGLAPHRGISHLLEAAGKLPDGWSIVMMGWGKMQDKVMKEAGALSANALVGEAPLCIIPPCPQEELAEWTAGATLGAILYEDVGLNHLYCTPNKLWEYPNAGVPIVASRLVEMEAMIERWGTGFLLPRQFTAEDLVDVVASLTDVEIAAARAKCAEFSKAMSWAEFEPQLLASYALAEAGPVNAIASIRAAAE